MQANVVTVDQFSFATIPLFQMFNATELGIATSFIWKKDDQCYLITNWHVVTCRNSETGENLRADGGRPNRVGALFSSRSGQVKKVIRYIEIVDKDNAPLWFVHPRHGRKVDLVAIRLPEPDDQIVYNAINEMDVVDLRIAIGMDVFILGYPFGVEMSAYPVWKRGSVASEPELASPEAPFVLVDSASRPGMSGGPVIRRSWGNHLMANNTVQLQPSAKTKVMGVYSGRLHTHDKNDAQLARVWPIHLVEEIVAAFVLDREI